MGREENKTNMRLLSIFCCFKKKEKQISKENKSVDAETQFEETDILNSVSKENVTCIERTTFAGKRIVLVHSIYDGDTLDLVFVYNGGIERKACRLTGIDAPEMKLPRLIHGTPEEQRKRFILKELAVQAKQYLSIKTREKEFEPFIAIFDKNDKYGRPMVTLFRPEDSKKDETFFTFENSINQMMVSASLAKPYFGKTKEKW